MTTQANESTNQSTIVGIFEELADAQRAVEELRRAAFREDQIGVAAQDPEQSARAEAERHKEKRVEEGTVAGAIAGAGVGGLWAIGIAAGLVPAIGPVIAGGVLGSLVASVAGTAAVGGLAGALVGLEIHEDHAHFYSTELSAGRTLVTVKPEGRFDEASAIISRNNGFDINHPDVAGRAHAHHHQRHMHLATKPGHAESAGHVGPGGTVSS